MTQVIKNPDTPFRPRKYYVGQEFPNGRRITAVQGRNKHGHAQYAWECMNCGTPGSGPMQGHMIQKAQTSGRCCPLHLNEKSNYFGHGEVSGWRMAKLKETAKKRNLELNVTAEYLQFLWVQQDGKCAYTGRRLFLSQNKSGDNASLDRIDSSLGYIEGNVQWVHVNVNRLKWSLREEDFIELCIEVANHRGRKK